MLTHLRSEEGFPALTIAGKPNLVNGKEREGGKSQGVYLPAVGGSSSTVAVTKLAKSWVGRDEKLTDPFCSERGR
ncbi:MAG: hypothetical protein YPKNTGVA_000280 [Candidatus Fervidibacter sp.]|jgi:hypothetical protein